MRLETKVGEEKRQKKKKAFSNHLFNVGLRVTAGIAFYRQGEKNEALRCLFGAKKSLEALHLSAIIYIDMNRLDAAKRCYEKMIAIDEDATLTQLTSGWISLAAGGWSVVFFFFNRAAINQVRFRGKRVEGSNIRVQRFDWQME